MEAIDMNTKSDIPRRNPYDVREEPQGVGMSALEMLLWLLIMAVLSLGMIWLLWTNSR
ncbi:hypothetical protein [Collinsella tanakaei]|uniref:hypothetical protein n=1 Tax=Collinsella tanakaei TaxID=626935 RepID=UPI001F32624D|nr:hypothetical protein [Collinsella tanakaei]MCF2621534.1 hypothetical protein [Collinsella tanakaei]